MVNNRAVLFGKEQMWIKCLVRVLYSSLLASFTKRPNDNHKLILYALALVYVPDVYRLQICCPVSVN